jgi:hypothetical protein
MFCRQLVPISLLCLFSHLQSAEETAIFPLKDVKRGMTGEWRTVIAGTKIETFKLRVLGVQKNFAGPRRPVIICEALDEENKLSGPVAGMSGSPVYIKKKLLGAYAYGFMMSKQQAIIGVTPIAQMLEVVENYGAGEVTASRPAQPSPALIQHPIPAPQGLEDNSFPNLNPELQHIQQFLKPVPTPLFVSGFSARTLKEFEDDIATMGMDIVQAPTAGVGDKDESFDPPLVPGAPVAGVLMDGDFSISGVGTITWRKGNRILAFGHPFFQEGPVEIPMAGAEVLTVVRSVSKSFKLSNVGPIKGSIYQDRLTAIAGEIGRETPITKMSIHIQPQDGPKRTLTSKIFNHRRMSPTFCAMALMESINNSMDTENDQSFQVTSTLRIAGHEPLVFKNYGSNSSAVLGAARGVRSAFSQIVNNPFNTPMVEEVTFDVSIHNKIDYSVLKTVSLRSGNRPKAGDKVKLGLELAHHKADRETLVIEIPIPKGYSGERLVLFAGDAGSAKKIDLPANGEITSLDDIIDRLRIQYDNRLIHLKLLRRTRGLNLRGAILPELPPSVYEIYTSDTRGEIISNIRQTTIWETTIPVKGEFRGSYSFPLDIR